MAVSYRSKGRGINRKVYPVSGKNPNDVHWFPSSRGSTTLVKGEILGSFGPDEHPLDASDINWLYDNGYNLEIDGLVESLKTSDTPDLGSIQRESGLGITSKGIFFADNALWRVIQVQQKQQASRLTDAGSVL